MKQKLLFIFGTRPEAIKMAPLILAAKKDNSFEVTVCVTGQHQAMLHQVLDFFYIKPDYDLAVMQPNQSLFTVTSSILQALEPVITKEKPDLILVQGDTTTAFVGALAAFYFKTKVAHIEAGLRSQQKYSPFPEEINRILAGCLSDYHFAPTSKARDNLLREGKDQETISVVGNTVIDALFLALDNIKEHEDSFRKNFSFINFSKKIILVTGHRRESFGQPFLDICQALAEIAKDDTVEIIYPVHLNPNVRKPVFDVLANIKNIHLIDPLDYPQLVWMMNKSYFVLTDSGGIQEEAPSLGKPVLVMREVTERTEGIDAGSCLLVGTKKEKIVQFSKQLLQGKELYEKMSSANNPYGDGTSSQKILSLIKKSNLIP